MWHMAFALAAVPPMGGCGSTTHAPSDDGTAGETQTTTGTLATTSAGAKGGQANATSSGAKGGQANATSSGGDTSGQGGALDDTATTTSGLSGSGGMAGTSNVQTTYDDCTDPDFYDEKLQSGYDMRVQSAATGTNGAFTDHCDADGNLVEYGCEMLTMCDEVTGNCWAELTGAVDERTVDCGGTCSDGACFQWCLKPEDSVRFETVAENSVRVVTLGKDPPFAELVCTVDEAIGGYDCLSPSLQDFEFTFYTQELTCTVEGVGFWIDDYDNGLGDDCGYVCQRE